MDDDPWREMAIEKQFCPLVDVSSEFPATLAYLDEETRALKQELLSDENRSYNLHVDKLQRMDMTYDYLLAYLAHGQYALALMTMLWGESDLTWKEMMEETLDEPGQLLSEAAGFGYTLIGM